MRVIKKEKTPVRVLKKEGDISQREQIRLLLEKIEFLKTLDNTLKRAEVARLVITFKDSDSAREHNLQRPDEIMAREIRFFIGRELDRAKGAVRDKMEAILFDEDEEIEIPKIDDTEEDREEEEEEP